MIMGILEHKHSIHVIKGQNVSICGSSSAVDNNSLRRSTDRNVLSFNEVTAVFMLKNPHYHHTSHRAMNPYHIIHLLIIREVKTFSTKTSRDVGMVPSVSKEHMCLHGKINWQKNFRNKEGYHSMLNNPG